MPAGLRLVPRPPDLAMILQLSTLYKIKADGRKKAPHHAAYTLRSVLAVAAEHALDVRAGDVTQAHPQADWQTNQKVYARIPEGYKRRDKNGRKMVAEVGNMYWRPTAGSRVTWYKTAGKTFIDFGLTQSEYDPCLFTW
eukprot:6165130-Pleurochrysis_carterae.AAC.4